jgi:hypothetical protein
MKDHRINVGLYRVFLFALAAMRIYLYFYPNQELALVQPTADRSIVVLNLRQPVSTLSSYQGRSFTSFEIR